MDEGPLAAWLRDEPAEAGEEPAASAPEPPLWADQPQPRRSRRLLFAMAALPWLVLGVLAVVRAAADGDAAGTSAAPRPGADGATTRAVERASDGGRMPAGADTAAARAIPGAPSSTPAGEDGEALAAVGATAIRAALIDVADGPRRYAEAVTVESVTWTGDVAVVVASAVLLEGNGRRWTGARPARYAIPATTAGPDGPQVLATAWPLPAGPTDELSDAAWQSVDDRVVAQAVRSALRDAGYRDVRQVAVARSAEVPGVLRAQVQAVAPGERRSGRSTVWLGDGPAPRVLGVPAAPATAAGQR